MYKLSIILYANNEVDSLKQVIQEIVSKVKVNYELIVYLKNKNCDSYFALQEIMKEKTDWNISYRFQKETNFFSTLFEVATFAEGTHLLVWTADNEIDTDVIVPMADLSMKLPHAIICASKFHKDSVLNGYGRVKWIVRKSLDSLIRVLYRRKGHDFYSVNKIMPLEYFDEMYFSSSKNLPYEFSLVALKLGKEYIEVPVVFHKRTEGKSNFNFLYNIGLSFKYLACIFRVFFTPKRILRTKRKLTLE